MKEKTNKKKSGNKPAAGNRHNSNYPWHWILVIALVVLTFVVFYPMLQNQFTSWDDPDYITKNTRIWKLNAENLKFIFTQPMAYNYHPFTMLSLGINYYFSKLNPYSYFLTNLLLHLLNTLLVLRFVYMLSKKNIHVAFFCALIFAIHPMHVESVAWATERKDVLYTFFFLAGLITWLYYLESKRVLYLIFTFLMAAFSMFSKPAAIIFPLMLMALDYYQTGKLEIKAQLNKIPFFLLAAFFLYMTFMAQTQDNSVVGDFKKFSVLERLFLAGYGFMVYIFKLFIPTHLATFHPYPKPLGLLVYASPLLVGVMAAGIYFSGKNRRLLVFGMLFYLINLLLVLQFVSIGDAVYAERYTYVPYIGLCFIIGMLLFNGGFKVSRNVVWAGIIAYSLVLSYTANARVKVWRSSETLWTDMTVKYPESDRGYYDLGNYYFEKLENDKAINYFSKAIAVGTNYKSYTNRGLVYEKQLKYEEAIKDFDKAIELKPNQDEAYLGRSHVYGALKKFDEAMKDVNAALKFRESYESYFYRGVIYKNLQQYDLAIADYSKAMTLATDVGVYTNRGNVYFQLNDFEKAIADYDIVLNANPNDANALSNRGAAYFQSNKFEEAMRDINRSLQLDPNNARNYANLAFMYEKQGNKAKALENANKALKMGVNFPPEFLAKIQN